MIFFYNSSYYNNIMDPPRIYDPNYMIKPITPNIIKPIPINKTQSISPEPAFKRMRII